MTQTSPSLKDIVDSVPENLIAGAMRLERVFRVRLLGENDEGDRPEYLKQWVLHLR